MGELCYHSHAGPQLCICAVDCAWKLLNLKGRVRSRVPARGRRCSWLKVGGPCQEGQGHTDGWSSQLGGEVL